DDLLDVPDRDRVDAREGLVEQEVLRVRDERPGDLEASPLAAGEGVCRIGRQRRQPELGEELTRTLSSLAARQLERLEDRQEILLDGELAEDRRLLREVADAHAAAPVHGQTRDLFSLEEDAAAVGRQEAHHHVERRRLPGAVRAQQADDLSTLDVERHVVDDLAALEPLHDPLRDEPFHPSDPSRQLLHDSPGLRPCPFCLPSSRGEKTALTRSCLPPWTTARSSESSIVMVSPLTTLSFCQTRASPMRTTRCSRSKYSARGAVAV